MQSHGNRGDTTLHLAARSGDATRARQILAESNPDLVRELVTRKNQDGETALYVSAQRGHHDVVREVLKACDVQSAEIKARNGFNAFHIAATQGHIDVLKELLHAFPALSITTNRGNGTALHTAATQGHIDIVNLLLETDASVTMISRDTGMNALHSAVRMGHLEVVAALLNKDPGMSRRSDKKGRTPLHIASKYSNAQILLELLKHDVSSINILDRHGNTPLHTAARNGRTIIVQTLISVLGIRINAVNDVGETAFDIAETEGHGELVNVLREAGGTAERNIEYCDSAEQVDFISSCGNHHRAASLHNAARVGNASRVRKIFAACDPELVGELLAQQNAFGETALHVSVERGHLDVVCEILKSCDLMSVGIKTMNGFDAFHIAARQGHLEILMEMLQAFPSLSMTTDSVNGTALHSAVIHGHIDVVNLLLETNISLAKIPRNNGKTVLHFAARMGQVEVVNSLLNKAPEIVFIRDRKGQTALHMASKGQNPDILIELLKVDVSAIHVEDRHGNRPLHIAVRKGRSIMVRTLISVDTIDITAVTKYGETALDIAKKRGNFELASILREACMVAGKGQQNRPNSPKQLDFLPRTSQLETRYSGNLEAILEDQNAEPCNLRLQCLRDITHDFCGERELGRGGFGVVYRGILPNGERIAVKKLVSVAGDQEKQFKNEVDNLMRVRHQNIVRFIGYCYETWMTYVEYHGEHIFAETPQRLLCFEYMSNRSLDRYISDESCGLVWPKRYKVIKGICCGLNYLHEECRIDGSIIHLDLKPANILLDDGMVPKIADFGLSRLFHDKKTRTCATIPAGSLGYMAPEYLFQGVITTKVDIYSLGVIILEVIAGRKISPYDTGASCCDFVEMVLKNWMNRLEATQRYASLEIYYQQIKICLEIGLACVKFDPLERPAVKEIIGRFNS